MNTHQALSVIVLIAVFVGTSEAVKCWKCNKATETGNSKKKCNDVDTLDNKVSSEYGDCASGLMCKKSVKGDMVELACQTNAEKDYTSAGCYKNTKDKKEQVCFCDKDDCNGAGDSAPALFLVTMAALTTIFFMH